MATSTFRSAPSIGSFSILRQNAGPRPGVDIEERCELCGQFIGERHQHLVDIEARSLLCSCRPCYLLFTDEQAELKYRAVPSRYVWFSDFSLTEGQWEDLEIPVNLAFFFTQSILGSTVAFYPSPAGATESQLALSAWKSVLNANPGLAAALPDVEAILIRHHDRVAQKFECFLLPIDSCYELVGRLRRAWHGFDGGSEAREQLNEFFERLFTNCQSVPAQPRAVQE